MLARRARAAALALLIAAALFGISARKADAAVGVTKTLCDASNCGLHSVSPTAPLYYKITLSAPSNTPTTVQTFFPVGFVVSGTPTCTAGSNAVTVTNSRLQGP